MPGRRNRKTHPLVRDPDFARDLDIAGGDGWRKRRPAHLWHVTIFTQTGPSILEADSQFWVQEGSAAC